LSALIRILSSFEGFKGLELKEIDLTFLNKLHKPKKKPLVEVEANIRKEEMKKIVTEEKPQVTLQETFQRKKDYSEALEELKVKLLFAFDLYGMTDVKVTNYKKGPHILRFYLDIGSNPISKLKKISKEIKLQLGQGDVLFDQSRDGLYLDVNITKSLSEIITFRDIHDEFDNTLHKPWQIPVGRTAIGDLLTLNIRELPHLIIAGTTGSGKSVFMNMLICSMIFEKSPDDLQLILIDPKMVEFAPYEDLPHLVYPVLTEMEEAIKVLAWLTEEMDDRYKLLAKYRVRDLDKYNRVTEEEPLPVIVCCIEEMADLVLVYPEAITFITRLAQKARACGIHLILATQNPVIEVVPTLIKANVPTRIAFKVPSNANSRVILDYVGAEKLGGNGDGFLSMPTESNLIRFQGGYINDDEIDVMIQAAKKFHRKDDFINIDSVDTEAINEKNARLIASESNKKKEIITVKETESLDKEVISAPEQIVERHISPKDFNETEKKVFLHLCKFLYEHDCGDRIMLPPRDVVREELSIGKNTLNEVISKLETIGFIETEGSKSKMTTYFCYPFDDACDYIEQEDRDYF